MKTQLCENSILIWQISAEMDARQRDILALSKNIEIFKRNEDNLWLENIQLRDLVMNIEHQRLEIQAWAEQSLNENRNLKEEISRLKHSIASSKEQ